MDCTLTIKDEVNVSFTGLSPEHRRKLVSSLEFMVPYARHMPSFKLGRWNGKKSFATMGGGTYYNMLDRVLPMIIEAGYNLEVVDKRVPVTFDFPLIDEDYFAHVNWPEGHPMEGQPIKLREHQVRAINLYVQNPQSLQTISTSAGKTIITAALSKMVEPHGRTLVVVPGKDLVRQTRLDYVNCGLDAGVYFGDEKQTDNKHIIATWQSLTALNNNNPDTLAKILDGCVCVMVDECHTIKGEELRKLLCGTLSDIPLRWGLSGTIQKEDHEFFSLLCSIGPVVGEIRADELMEKGILSNCHIHIQQLIDDVDYKDYETELDYLCTDRRRLEYITKYCENIAKTGNTLVLINRIVMGEEISSKLGVPFINGKVASKKRAEEYRNINYTDNQLIVATFGVASTGINLPRIFNLVLIEPGKSFVRVVQSIGRGLRTAADKNFVNIYDVCSNAKFSKRHLTTRKGFYREANYPFKVEKVSYK